MSSVDCADRSRNCGSKTFMFELVNNKNMIGRRGSVSKPSKQLGRVVEDGFGICP